MKNILIILLVFNYCYTFAQPKEMGFTNTNIIGNFEDKLRVSILKIDTDGNQYITGMFKNNSNFKTTILNTTNQDCKGIFIAKFDRYNQLVYVKKIAEEDSDSYYGNIVTYNMVLDNSNNIYVGITFKGKLYKGIDTITSNGGLDFIIAKYTTDCIPIYTKHIGSINDEGVSENGMFVSTDNGLLLTGSFNDSWTNIYPNYTLGFGNDTLYSNSADLFYAKFDANGNNVFVRSFNSNGTQFGTSIIEHKNSLYILGFTTNSYDTLGGIILSYMPNYFDNSFLLKLDMQGNGLWGRKMGSADLDCFSTVKKILVNEDRISILGGGSSNFTTKFAFDGGATLNGNRGNFFIVTYDTSGNFVWNTISKNTYGAVGNNINVDSNANIYISGGFSPDLTVGTIKLESFGQADLFVASYTKNGNVRYAITGGGSYTETGMSLAINADKQIVLLGYTNSPGCIFSNDTIYPSANKSTLFVTTIDSVLLPPAPDAIDIIAKNLQDALVYPNPTNTTITIAYTQASTANISISNAMGQVVYVYRANHNYYNHKTVDIQHLHSGLYFITISDEKNKITKKINIQTNN